MRHPRITGRAAVAALRRRGFVIVRRRGSHVYLRVPHMPAIVVVPDHAGQTLPVGTLHAILGQANLTLEEFVALL